MYELYYSPGACSLATQVILRELQQEFKIINKQTVDNFNAINPVGSVPVLVDGNSVLTEGAAIILHLLKKHNNSLLPVNAKEQQKAVQNIMFANATVHPAYSKLFFIAQNITDDSAKQEAFNHAGIIINQLWQVVEKQLSGKKFIGGNSLSAADIMLAVYARWGEFFPVEIRFGEYTSKMLTTVQSMASFESALQAEQEALAE